MIWVPVVIGLAVGGMILAASRWAASSPPPAPPARPAPATDKQRAYLRVLLAERDDAGKFIASDDPGLSKLAASKLIRRLLREREQRRRKPEADLGRRPDRPSRPGPCVWCDSGGTAQDPGPLCRDCANDHALYHYDDALTVGDLAACGKDWDNRGCTDSTRACRWWLQTRRRSGDY